ncbi:MAG: carboxymuconolactone decarboxylase family protein [Proteobacteria bacterium]|nr:carboxymuconolactone decarboxylase family protein [Pseudomonadota bacterium]
MALMPYPDRDKLNAEVKDMLGRLPAPINIFSMMAHGETVLKPVMKLGGTLLGKLKLDPLLRELCLLKAVKIANGEYEWVQHVPVALDLGGTDAQIKALEAGNDRAPCFDATQQAALVFTGEMIAKGKASPEALAALRKHLSEREVVELIVMAGFYTMLARFTETLGIENEPPIGKALVRGIEARVKGKG